MDRKAKEALADLRKLDDPNFLRDRLWGWFPPRKEHILIIASENKEEAVQRMAKYYLTKEQWRLHIIVENHWMLHIMAYGFLPILMEMILEVWQ